MMKSRWRYFWLLVFAVMFGHASVGEAATRPASVSGKWQISREARPGARHSAAGTGRVKTYRGGLL